MNEIGARGARHLAAALSVNQVGAAFFILCSHLMVAVSQTLTTLNLSLNPIGSEGAKHLAAALSVNQVKAVFFMFCT